MALGAVGSPHVFPPLERLALHASVPSDRQEAAAAVVRIAARHPGPRARKALEGLLLGEDPEVRGMASAALRAARPA